MSEIAPETGKKRKTGLIVGLSVGLVLCVVAGIGLLGVGGAALSLKQATAQAGVTETALAAQQQATTTAQVMTSTALAQAEAATALAEARTATALAKSAASTATARAVAATAFANFAASTATAQFRADASTATARVRQTQATPTHFVPASIASNWPLVVFDTFDSNSGGWPTGPYSDTYGSGSRNLSDGQYQWSAAAKEGRVWRLNYKRETASDFYLAVDVLAVSGSPQARYGLVLRDNGKNYYFFDVGSDRQFAFYVWSEDKWTTLVGLARSEAIAAGGVNRLAALAQGGQFTLFINDQQVAQATDSRLSKGQMGLAVNFVDKTEAAVLKFDNFEVREP